MSARVPDDGSGEIATGTLHREVRGRTNRFDRFVRGQYSVLLRFLRHHTASLQDAEDVAQESVVKLLRYRDSASASDWQRLLYRIAINAAHDRFRYARQRPVVSLGDGEDDEVASAGSSPDEFAARQQQLARLRRALLQLPPKCQRVCLFRLTRGLTNAEIARCCGISVKMVEKHLARGLAELRKKVGDSTADPFR